MDILKETTMLSDEIAEKINESQVYKDYKRALERIEKDSELMEKIRQIKQKHLEFAEERKRGINDFNKEKYISQELYKIMLNEDARTFFKNEEKLVKLVTDIYFIVSEKCSLNIFI